MRIRAGEPVIGALARPTATRTSSPTRTGSTSTREANPHLGFGHGVHHCIGAQLARMELQVVAETLIARCPACRWRCGIAS